VASATISTPVGPFSIVAQGKSVLASGFTDELDSLVALIHPTLRDDSSAEADLDPILSATRAYFDGELAAIDTIDVEQHTGGHFLDHAWDTLREVSGGESVTYTELATRAGRPTAIRAAAQACARNAAALFVPCHRIVRSDGGLGGYRWGIETKRWLLAYEQIVSGVRPSEKV
jgi:methylated-DNA-[protein]-cysteine S-methyltransferase